MKYEGYLSRQEVLQRIESAFPFVEKPAEEEFYRFGAEDILRKIIQSEISHYVEPELPYDGVACLYGELSTLLAIGLFNGCCHQC